MIRVLPLLVAVSLEVVPAGPRAAPSKAVKPAAVLPVIEGTVKGPDGRPIEKALVVARIIGASRLDLPASARTDPTGAFRVTLKRAGLYDVRAEAKGLAARTIEKVRPGATLSITLAKGRSVEGTVRDATTGEPVVGARVEARENGIAPVADDPLAGVIEAVSDAKGRYRLEGLRDAAHVLSVAAKGYGRAFKTNVVPGRTAAFLLLPGVSLSGTVWGPQKKPVEGALVQAEREMPGRGRLRPEVTDAQGRYEVMGITPGPYRLVVRHKDHAPTVVSGVYVEAAADSRVDVVMDRPVPLIGRLVGPDPEARVVGSVTVTEIDGKPAPVSLFDVLHAETDAGGRFRLMALGPGDHVLEVTAPGYASRRVEVSVRVGAQADAGDIALEVGLAIRGKVKDKAGAPVADARIEAMPSSRVLPGRWTAPRDARSEADGSFAVAGLDPGPYRLRVLAPGFAEAERPAEAGADKVEIVLSPAGTITGLVVDEKDRPVEAFHAVARSAAREGRGIHRYSGTEATAHPEGRFTLEDLDEGTYVVEVTASEHPGATVSDVKVTPGTSTDVGRVRLTAGGTVKGIVVDTSGGAISGARVMVVPHDPGFPSIFGLEAESDMGGAFEILGVPLGTVDVTARHPSFAEGQVAGLEVETGKGPAEARIVLSPGGRVEGTVRKRDGTGVPGMIMSLKPMGDRFMVSDANMAGTRADGAFAFEHVPVGRSFVVLSASSAGAYMTSEEKEVEIRQGETTIVDFVIREIVVSGHITRSGAPAPGLRVTIRSRQGRSYFSFGPGLAPASPSGPQRMTGVTREHGAYELLLDLPGPADLSVDALDGSIGFPRRLVEIPDVDAHTIDVNLSGVPVTGIVVEKDTDAPIAQARVTAALPGKSGATTIGGADGRFRFELDPGEYRILANASEQGYGSGQTSVTVDSGGAPEIRLALSRGLGISGKAVDPGGRGLGGLSVFAQGQDAGAPSFGYGQTLPDGSFRIDGLSSGAHILTVSTDTGLFALRSGIAAGAEGVVLTLRPGGRIRLQVNGPDGSPLAGAWAAVTKVDGVPFPGGNPAPQTDALGITEMVAPAGVVDVDVRKGALRGRAAVNVSPGEVAAATVRVAQGPSGGNP
jgi:protocatechuate 3,4-dioxygenase beta subunit